MANAFANAHRHIGQKAYARWRQCLAIQFPRKWPKPSPLGVGEVSGADRWRWHVGSCASAGPPARSSRKKTDTLVANANQILFSQACCPGRVDQAYKKLYHFDMAVEMGRLPGSGPTHRSLVSGRYRELTAGGGMWVCSSISHAHRSTAAIA